MPLPAIPRTMSYQAFRPSYRHLVSALAELKLRRNGQWMASADAPKRRERYWVFKQNKTARRRSLCNLIGRVTRFPLRRSAASIVLPAVMRARAKIGFRILASLRARSARLSTQSRRSKSRVKRDRECTAHLPVAWRTAKCGRGQAGAFTHWSRTILKSQRA
jgi:hypothetical protein